MSLRCSSRLTPASLAARRGNAQRSTGPRTERGKARVGLNALKHGRYAIGLPERLVHARCPNEAARWQEIRSRIARTFEATFKASDLNGSQVTQYRHEGDPSQSLGNKRSLWHDPGKRHHDLGKRIDQMANGVWCSHRSWQQLIGAKLEYPLKSVGRETRLLQPSMNWVSPWIQLRNPWARLGLVFYTQRRRGWVRRQFAALIGGGTVPDAGLEMETGLRSRVYRLGRPRYWERIRYCLDREGHYHPEWRGPYRKVRQELRNAGLAFLLEPHPVLATLRQKEENRDSMPGG